MLRLRFLSACFAASCTLGGASLLAADAAKTGLSLEPSVPNGAALVTMTHSNTPGALLKTFSQPVVETSLNKPTSLAFQVGVPGNAAGETSKINPLIQVEALPVPEPTALFLAGSAGCLLLALAHRLRGTRAGLR